MSNQEAAARRPFDITDVTGREMCVGCGACSALTQGRIPMEFTELGLWRADTTEASADDLEAGSAVCPFSDYAKDEDALSYPTSDEAALPHDVQVGSYSTVYAGRRTNEDDLLTSSSGGITSYLLERLLAEGEVDGVIHVGASDAPGRLVDFQISYEPSGVAGARKSRYYSTTLADVLPHVRGDGRRYALVGIPCYIKAARLVAEQDPVLGEQLSFYVGLICGHMKSAFFAESLAWQAGIAPRGLEQVDFRVKNPERPASQYDFSATSTSGEVVVRRMQTLVGWVWGHGSFQPEACNFCDDIFAETADVVLGDAWLGEYAADWRGTNVVVSRNPVIDALLASGVAENDLVLTDLSVSRAAASQGGNFRHRRDGLRVRLADDLAAGLRVPRKRWQPGYDHVTPRRAHLIRHRRLMSRASLQKFAEAKRQDDLDIYLDGMRDLISHYEHLGRPSLPRQIKARVGRAVSPLRTRVRAWRSRRSAR